MLKTYEGGPSQTACDIVNETFLSLDGFEGLRRQMDAAPDYPAIAFAYELARITDRVLKGSKHESSETN